MKEHKNRALDELKEMLPSLIVYNGIVLIVITALGFAFGFEWRLYTGLIAGNAVSVGNFLLIGYTAGIVTRERKPARGQFIGNFSYGARYIGMFVILALLLMFKLISLLTAAIPLFYTKIYYTIKALRGNYDE